VLNATAAPAAAAAAARHHPTTTACCSYYDIMLAPIADALRDSLAAAAAGEFLRNLPGQKRPLVYFAMQVRASTGEGGCQSCGSTKPATHCIAAGFTANVRL
jgi:hypothetical protein